MAPAPVGAELAVEVVLERVAGRRLGFAVRLRDGDRPVASGLITYFLMTSSSRSFGGFEEEINEVAA